MWLVTKHFDYLVICDASVSPLSLGGKCCHWALLCWDPSIPMEIRGPMAMAASHTTLPGLWSIRTTELFYDADGCLNNVLFNVLVKEGSSGASGMRHCEWVRGLVCRCLMINPLQRPHPLKPVNPFLCIMWGKFCISFSMSACHHWTQVLSSNQVNY